MEENQESGKQRRERRNKVRIHLDIMDGLEKLIQEEGFSDLNISKLSKASGTDINAIIRHFQSFEGVIRSYLHQLKSKYDYQQVKYMDMVCLSENQYGEFLQSLLEDIVKDKRLQQVFRWECSGHISVVNEFACHREVRDEQVIIKWKELFADDSLPIDAITALLVGGIRYILINRKNSLMYGIDFSTRKGQALLKEVLLNLSELIIQRNNIKQERERIKGKMRENGISQEIIDKCFHS